ncbi:MAG: hypothetical protein AAGF26_04040 [Cyanobacteria bacterium P01_G01_bin.49]
MMLTQFRMHYPQGSLISELVTIDHGKYIVRVLVQINGVTLGTGLASDDKIEVAEDRARERALNSLYLENQSLEQSRHKETVDTKESVELSSVSPEKEPEPIAKSNKVETTKQSIQPSSSSEKSSSKSSKKLSNAGNAKKAVSTEEKPLPIAEIPVEPEIEEKPLPIAETPVEPEIEQKPLPIAETLVEPEIEEKPPMIEEETLDFSDIIARSNAELKRLGWTTEQGREYLIQTYGKRSRQVLSDEELLEFLHHLESLPTPS